MAIRVNISVGGLRNLQAKATARANFLGGSGMREVLQDMGKELVARIQKNEQSFRPGPVRDLTPKYRAEKRKLVGSPYPILWRTGYMMSHMYSRVKNRAILGFRNGKWSIAIGFGGGTHPGGGISTAKLAEAHIKGLGNLPARDFLKLPERITQRLQRKVQAALRTAK